MSDTTIDEIFAEFGRKCSPVATLKNVDNPLVRREYIDQAKSALYDLILKEVVGANRHDIVEVEGTDITDYMNMHRSLQRNKLKKLFDA